MALPMAHTTSRTGTRYADLDRLRLDRGRLDPAGVGRDRIPRPGRASLASGAIRRRSFLALLAAATLGVITTERHGMDFNDSLENRIYQLVNSTCKAMNGAGTGAAVSIDGNDAIGQ